MRVYRTINLRRLAASLALLGLLLQAGFSVWHATAMFAGAVGGAEMAAICHPDAAATNTTDQSGSSPEGETPPTLYQNCPCCLGLAQSAALFEAPAIPELVYVAGEARTEAKAAERLGRHPLAPQGRGPPQTV